jgi:hypothetical protein
MMKRKKKFIRGWAPPRISNALIAFAAAKKHLCFSTPLLHQSSCTYLVFMSLENQKAAGMIESVVMIRLSLHHESSKSSTYRRHHVTTHSSHSSSSCTYLTATHWHLLSLNSSIVITVQSTLFLSCYLTLLFGDRRIGKIRLPNPTNPTT